MADITEALAAQEANLPPFEGRQVIRSTMQLTKAGDGLSNAVRLEPRALHHDDEGYLLVKYRVTKVNHEAVKDTDALSRVHTLETLEVAIVEDEDVDDLMAAQLERRRRREDELKGRQQLPMDDEFGGGDDDGGGPDAS